jgi:Peptidase family M1 domain
VRKLLFLALFTNCLLLIANCQSNYWQQEVNFTIDVKLNDKDNSLDAFERIDYINNSPDTLRFIWFHLWPNAYKNDKTAFSDQLLENGSTKFYFSGKEEKGYINRLDFKVNDATAETEDHPQHIDIIKLILPSPLPPGKKIVITTPFHVKLPFNFSRGGHDGETYQITQWYPKPAVYDAEGWHPMPYLDQGEYYAEFGTFDVSITVPKNYVVAATGELQDASEKAWLQSRVTFTWTPEKKKQKTKAGGIKTIVQKFPVSLTESKTIRFKQDRVHDFAWFADKRFIFKQDTCQLLSGKIISVQTYYTKEEESTWKNCIIYGKRAVRFYSQQLGEYPYNVVSVVQGPKSFGGGMEYPTITAISPINSSAELELTTAHEIGHNWFYGILATNERKYPWMDEGINTFYENLYKETYHNSYTSSDKINFETAAIERTDQPIETSSEQFSEANYGLVAYYKTGEWMKYLKSELGGEQFTEAMKSYYHQWQFKHPQPGDFKKAMEESAGKNLDSVFTLLNEKGLLPGEQKTGTKIISLLQPEHFNNNWYSHIHSKKNIITIGPLIGFNSYDKFMIGGLVTNLNHPPTALQFFAAPMYGTGSKKFTGIGFINYSFYQDGMFRKIDLNVSASKFSSNEFKRSDGKKIYYGFTKLAPGIRFTLKEKNPRNNMNWYIQWKTFFFNEETYRVKYDTTFNPPDTTINQVINIVSDNRTLNQLKIVVENFRVLYPYRGELKIEQGKYFIRAAFTGKYFFNYAKGGGLNVRLFAGKFFYTAPKTFSKQFATDLYHLNLTGANGYEDYTYSDYFIGRNKFEGFTSQQIMERDGGFKVRTDLLGDKVGKTDNWLMALNFSSSVIKNIPINIFADIGTYAEAWDRNANQDRFLFDAGIHIPILKQTINIYVPLMYSRVFKDYIQSYLPKKNRFFKTISFSIDISNFTLRKFNRNLAF